MKKQLLYRAAAATVLGLSLATGGVAAAAPNTHHNNQNNGGNQSLNAGLSVNASNVGVSNMTEQNAASGPATVSGGSNNNNNDHHNHDMGGNNSSSSGNSATSGPAENSNSTQGTVGVSQTPAVAPSSDPSQGNGDGHGSNTSTDVNASVNLSNVQVNNETDQNAVSGPATVSGNNKAGSAVSGPAENSNSTDFTVSVDQ